MESLWESLFRISESFRITKWFHSLLGGDWNMAGLWLSINIGNVIIPTDELHDFSEGLVNHQPASDSIHHWVIQMHSIYSVVNGRADSEETHPMQRRGFLWTRGITWDNPINEMVSLIWTIMMIIYDNPLDVGLRHFQTKDIVVYPMLYQLRRRN